LRGLEIEHQDGVTGHAEAEMLRYPLRKLKIGLGQLKIALPPLYFSQHKYKQTHRFDCRKSSLNDLQSRFKHHPDSTIPADHG
jgi:hypothetical protein